ncbi:hypothetical protein KCV87_30240 [Actinosynnema pretiosum subsp. pretiosum]|uniref:Uncharacterized protein n=1 Tax=Actinosynnema pretiosum subsp. pretiosum TaxID=103721 RepID=A0AA45R3C7_9PSEU|nr:hypothetical protein APASM_5093 [Actinosynnema pretiosum subsp. pretiosum]QUF03619.1 hypothetical protein KCV87_30240 [Actinosynnema pretiosum subsp. pretiosum]
MEPRAVVDRLFERIAAGRFDTTITVQDRERDDRWVQLRGNSINLPHPSTTPPVELLGPLDLFGDLPWEVESWEPDGYATIDWGPVGANGEAAALTTALERLLRHLGLPADSERWEVAEG